MLIHRHQTARVIEAARDTPAVVVEGPRQVGKSTLARAVGELVGALQLRTLDDSATRNAARSDPDAFIDGLLTPVVIDEVQRAPDLLLSIKRRIDAERHRQGHAAGMFLLTGSAGFWDTPDAPESLAGRVEHIRLWPFSQSELAGRRENTIDALFENRPPSVVASTGRKALATPVIIGGFPEVQNRTEPRAQRWFSEYLSRLLDRDIRDLANVRSPDDLYRLLVVCAARSAGILNLDGMLSDLQAVSHTTGRRYYELLKRLYLVHELPAWGENVGRAAARAPKLLLCDSGLVAHLVGLSKARFTSGPDTTPGAGFVFETFVLTELLKEREWANSDPRAHHWRDRSGREVDLLLQARDGSIVAVEVKLRDNPTQRDFAHLTHLRDTLGERFRCGVVVCTAGATTAFGDRLWAMPVSALWSDPASPPDVS